MDRPQYSIVYFKASMIKMPPVKIEFYVINNQLVTYIVVLPYVQHA